MITGTDNYVDHVDHVDHDDSLSVTNRHNKVQLNEMFVSIEGEGILAGTKTLFIRFSGCHLKCHWCDTKYSLSPTSGKSYTIDEVNILSFKIFNQTSIKSISPEENLYYKLDL